MEQSPKNDAVADQLRAGVPWQSLAACLGRDPELFCGPKDEESLATRNKREQAARAICLNVCDPEVRTRCLTDSISHGDVYAVRGGVGTAQLKKIARSSKQVKSSIMNASRHPAVGSK